MSDRHHYQPGPASQKVNTNDGGSTTNYQSQKEPTLPGAGAGETGNGPDATDQPKLVDKAEASFPTGGVAGRPLQSFTVQELFIEVPPDFPEDLPLDFTQTTYHYQYQTGAGRFGYGTVLPVYEPVNGTPHLEGEGSPVAQEEEKGLNVKTSYTPPYPYLLMAYPNIYPHPPTPHLPDNTCSQNEDERLNPYSIKYNPLGRDKLSMWLAHQPLWVSYLVVAFWLLLILLFLGLLGWAIYIGIGGLTPAPSKVNPYTNTTSPGHEPPPTGMGAASPASHTARLIITLGGREQTTLVMPLNQLMPWPGQSVTTPASATPPPAAPASATATGTNAIPSFQGVSIVQPVELEVVVEGAHLATGVAEVGDGKATGAIRLFNPGSSGVTLPAGTWLATIKGQRYVLAERVYVPPTDIANQKLGTANTTVVAEKAGPDGNLASGLGRFNLGNGLQLQGLGPITGGTTRQIKTPSKSDLAELLTSLQSQSDARVRATLAALEAPKEGPGPDDNQALAGSRLPPNYQFLTGYDHTVLNSVFTPQVREGEEVTGPDGQVQGKLVLKVRALMYSPQALKKLANRIIATSPGATTTGADPSLSPTPEWELVTVKLVPPASTPAPAPLANGNPTGTGEINGQLAVTLERPVNYALLRAALTSQYQSWTGRAAQVGRLADDLRKLGGVESVQLVWPPDLNLNLNLTTPGAVSDAGAGGGTGAGAGASVGNNQDPLFKIALEFVEPSGPAQPQAAPTPTPATHLEGGNG